MSSWLIAQDAFDVVTFLSSKPKELLYDWGMASNFVLIFSSDLLVLPLFSFLSLAL